MTAFTTQSGWNAADIAHDTSWVLRFDGPDIQDLLDASRQAGARSTDLFELTRKDFDFSPRLRAKIAQAAEEVNHRSGMVLFKGVPVDRLDLSTITLLYWGLGLHLGVPRPQGKLSQFISDVRDAGGTYRSTQGRGYNTKAKLDFHADGSDLVGLICIKQAREGGDSMVTSSIRALQVMQAERPDLAERLFDDYVFSRQGEQAPDETPYYRASIFGEKQGQLFCRHIRNHINSAQKTFDDIPCLTPAQNEALDYFDEVLTRPALMYCMRLEKGDIQLLNNHAVLHSRTEYVDFEDPAEKRHLLRLWLASYDGPALPDSWKAAYKSVAPRSVRGGFKGTQITEQARQFVHRLAHETAMELPT
ncbi:MAG: TauD/TfdA family dioxygenase [Burkholderiaceae bacterium]|nr:TauD/TfdA family dioxygenase [Burkholderiaceae bacterium]